MAYPENLLGRDESVVVHLHPHWITLVPATLWFIVICGAAGAAAYFAPSHGTARTAVFIAIAVCGVVLLVWRVLAPWIRWRTTHYVFTTHRVLIRTGVFTHTGRDISLQRINDVGFNQSLWDRMVGAGTLTIESAGELGQERLLNIPHSDRMQQMLNRLIEEDGARRARQAYGGPPPGYPQGYRPPDQPYPPTQRY